MIIAREEDRFPASPWSVRRERDAFPLGQRDTEFGLWTAPACHSISKDLNRPPGWVVGPDQSDNNGDSLRFAPFHFK